MNKFFFLPQLENKFKPFDILHVLKTSECCKDWNIKKHEVISDRGLLVYVNPIKFKGSLLFTLNYNGEYIIRKINGFGLTLGLKKVKDIYEIPEIISKLIL